MKSHQTSSLLTRLIRLMFIVPITCFFFTIGSFNALRQSFYSAYQQLFKLVRYILYQCWPARVVWELYHRANSTWRRMLSVSTYAPYGNLARGVVDNVFGYMMENYQKKGQNIDNEHKILILMERLRKLENAIYQETCDRRKAEQEVFELSTRLAEKEMIIVKERHANQESRNKIEIMLLEIAEIKEEQSKLEGINSVQQSTIDRVNCQLKNTTLRINVLENEFSNASMNNSKADSLDLEDPEDKVTTMSCGASTINDFII